MSNSEVHRNPEEPTPPKVRRRWGLFSYLKRVVPIWLAGVALVATYIVDDVKAPMAWLWSIIGALAFTTPFVACFAVGWYWCRTRGMPYAIEIITCGIAFFFGSLLSQMLFNLFTPAEPLNLQGAFYWGIMGLAVPALTRIAMWVRQRVGR